jgi:hypothetical protein
MVMEQKKTSKEIYIQGIGKMRIKVMMDDNFNIKVWFVNFWGKPIGISLYDTVSEKYRNPLKDMWMYNSTCIEVD